MSAPPETAGRSYWGAGVQDVLNDLDSQAEMIVTRTEAWAQINSGSYERAGLDRMAGLLADAFAVLPGEISDVALRPSQRVRADGELIETGHAAAIRIRVRPDAPIQIALTGHYDTVFPAAHAFQNVWRAEGALRGPGVADMKGGLSLMLAALQAFEAATGDKRVGYEVLMSPDEEIGSPASATLLAELGARAHVGMTYEPAMADGSIVSWRKGSGNFSLAFRGRAAHVGRAFQDGRNAVMAAAETAIALSALNGQREGVTLNVGAIDGGGAVNVVPERAVLRFNVRAPDAESAQWADGEIRRIAADTSKRDGVSAHLHGGITRPPKPLTPQQETMLGWVRRAGHALGVEIGAKPSGGVCEGNNLAAAGCPNIDTLGPCGGGLHSGQEFALISSFAERAKLSFLMLDAINSGAFDVRSLRA
ncbi:carboxypeptidase G2 precursor [alpha proteobacterium U9-1i]|nr:carboxypeptidase G2 precursor [alpha proteobacterium U9-1i]